MRLGLVACSTLAACNALTGVSDLAVGEGEGPPSVVDAGSNDASRDEDGDVPGADATLEDAAAEADAKPDVTVDAGPPRPDGGRFVFTTAASFQGNLGGALGGDLLCNQAANAVGLGGKWIAWLSSSNAAAKDRLSATGPWYLVTGTLVSNRSGIETDNLSHPIDRTETGGLITDDERSWTGTKNGVFFNSACADWTTSGIGASGNAGSTKLSGAQWTATGAPNCGNALHLYCFEN